MKPYVFGCYDDQEEAAKQQAEGELRHLQKVMQEDYDLWKHLRGN